MLNKYDNQEKTVAKIFHETIYYCILVFLLLACSMQGISLAQNGNITGTITHDGGGLSGLTVTAFDTVTGASVKTSSTSVNGTGAYTISDIAPGTYRVRFSGNSTYARQYYLNTNTLDSSSATLVTVMAGATTPNIDFSLIHGGNITGTITSGGSPVSGVTITAYDAPTNASTTSAASNASGIYTISGLPPGSYKFRANPGIAGLATQYYPSAPNRDVAASVTVVAGTNGAVDFSLVAGRNITGTITSGGLAVSPSLTVNVYDAATGAYIQTSSASDASTGMYTIWGLVPDSYKVAFTGNSTYAQQYYLNRPELNSATPLTVAAGSDTSDIDFSLVAGGNVTGTVTSSGTPISGVTISVFDAVTGKGMNKSSSPSATDGTYTISGLPSGSYKFRANTGNTGLAVQWYSNMPYIDAATPVTVDIGSNGPIDFGLVEGAGNITGTIAQASDGTPVIGITVNAFDTATGAYVTGSTTSDINGLYAIRGLAPGSYKLRVNAGAGLTSQWYPAADTYTASPVTVTAGTTTSPIDFSLPTGNSITGYVTRVSDGQPLPGLLVYAYNTADNGATEWSLNSVVQGDGSYSVTGLPSGTYKVAAWGADSEYATQFYPNARNVDLAQQIVVTTSQTIPNVSFNLAIGGKISGTIRDATTHLPLQGAWVSVYHAETGAYVPFRSQTSAAGEYTTTGLPLGNYRIYASGSAAYVSNWYNNTLLSAAATPIAVTAGATNTGRDIDLTSGSGAITGMVLRQSDSQPVAGMTVAAYSALGRVKWVTTAFDGSYNIMGLPPGDAYAVSVEPRNKDYAAVFYPDALTQTTATLIGVTAGGATGNINFSLHEGGSVSGVVTNNTAVPLPGLRVIAYDWVLGDTAVGIAVVTSVDTQYDGSYTLTGLRTGNYRIKVYGPPQEPNNAYVAQYYNNQAMSDLASSINVTAGGTTTGIDFSLPVGGKISGVVRNAVNNNPISALQVRAYDASTRSIMASSAATAYDGSYVLTGLPAGSYFVQVRASGSDFGNMYYGGVANINLATPVSVTVGATTMDTNFNLVPDILYANFTGDGLYKYNGSIWRRVDTVVPSSMVASGSTLYASYTGYGLYKYNGSTWSRFDTVVPTDMVASGSTLYASYTGYGLYKYNGSTWSRIDTVVPTNMVVSGSTLYASYTGYGLYRYNGSVWSRLDTIVPTSMVVSGSTLYATFAGYGLYSWNGGVWSWLDTFVPTSITSAGSTLYATFAGYGLYSWNGSAWSRIDTTVPSNIAASGSALYASYTGLGIWKYEDGVWSQIMTTDPASMVASQ